MKTRIGIVGTGYIAKGLLSLIKDDPGLLASVVLSRRPPGELAELGRHKELVTASVQRLIDHSDLVVECSGDPIHGTAVISKVLEAGIPVVTMNAELQVMTGSWLQAKGLLAEAEGDQPGCLAALEKEVKGMGFKPLVYGNVKGFLNRNPTKEDMQYWARKYGLSLPKVTSFTDGTKVQVEQVLVANGLGADIACRGLMGIASETLEEGGLALADLAAERGNALSDYVLSPKSPGGVFIVATHQADASPYLEHYKMGPGPYYILTRPFHLCHFEVLKTVRSMLAGDSAFLNNGPEPRFSVAAVAKRRLRPGEYIEMGIGSFELRGEAVAISGHEGHLPVGLASGIFIKRHVGPGQLLTFDDVEMPGSLALSAWLEILDKKKELARREILLPFNRREPSRPAKGVAST